MIHIRCAVRDPGVEVLLVHWSASQAADGVDFFYGSRSHALKFIEFLNSVVPIKYVHNCPMYSYSMCPMLWTHVWYCDEQLQVLLSHAIVWVQQIDFSCCCWSVGMDLRPWIHVESLACFLVKPGCIVQCRVLHSYRACCVCVRNSRLQIALWQTASVARWAHWQL